MKRSLKSNVSGMGKIINTYGILVERLEGKEPTEMPWCRWEDSSKMYRPDDSGGLL
jgi:hypothetical protein